MTQDRLFTFRKFTNYVMIALCIVATVLAAGILVLVLGYTLKNGFSYINIDFITQTSRPLGEEGGGMRHEIIGTLILLGLATAMGLPIGLLAGTFLAEFGNARLTAVVRVITDVLTGVPSVVIGVFAYTLVVRPMGGFSAFAGGVGLAIIMLPLVARTTEEMMRLVPTTYREAGLALGVPRWRVIVRVIMPAAAAGIVTGALLAMARVAGETAPLIFTALGNRFGYSGLTEPIAALPLQIWRYAVSPYKSWHEQAWAASFVLVMLVLLTSILVRFVVSKRVG